MDAVREKEKLIKLLASRGASRRQLTWCCRPLSDLIVASKDNLLTHVESERTSSYLLLPDSYPLIISSGRDSKLRTEINDRWVSVASGSEDFSFKVTRKNMYEEQLCKCEDERFEYDMAINCCDSAVAAITALLPKTAEACEKGDT